MYLRKCLIEDCDILYKWANDKTVRINAFNTSPIPYSDHLEWFKKSISSESRKIFLCVDDDKLVGQIRIDEEDNGIGVISYLVDKDYRGKGVGSKMIKMIYEVIKDDYKNISALKGLVKKENKASQKVFLNNGYKESIEDEYIVYTLEISR